ncbi:MAG TPA: poly-beta-hydroxybutyrate polymerase N-terminal domain-containing protein, partial [Steroidobacteraceae bacterium]|nr:poly-beta-hydroxybutyrate polymerase N-terminal domain-containing protein [Steroidobacteraceae bacterium]
MDGPAADLKQEARAQPAGLPDGPSAQPTGGAESLSGLARHDMESPSGLDRLLRAALGRFTMGLSPASLWLAYA